MSNHAKAHGGNSDVDCGACCDRVWGRWAGANWFCRTINERPMRLQMLSAGPVQIESERVAGTDEVFECRGGEANAATYIYLLIAG